MKRKKQNKVFHAEHKQKKTGVAILRQHRLYDTIGTRKQLILMVKVSNLPRDEIIVNIIKTLHNN